MPDNNTQEQDRLKDGRFKAGVSGNPSGRPVGSKSKVSQLVNNMIAERAEDVTEVLVQNALDGDSGCLKLIIERLAPAPKDGHINIELPNIEQSGDLSKAIAMVISSVGKGDITPHEGQSLVKMFEGWKSAYSLEEIETRINQLEEKQNEKPG